MTVAIARLRQLLAEATQGTWRHDADEDPSKHADCAEIGVDDEEWGSLKVADASCADAKLIVAAVNAPARSSSGLKGCPIPGQPVGPGLHVWVDYGFHRKCRACGLFWYWGTAIPQTACQPFGPYR